MEIRVSKTTQASPKLKSGYVGWRLDPADRARLLGRFPPRFPDVYAHHITLVNGVKSDYPLPLEDHACVIGYARNDAGIECLVVEIEGSHDRPDGGVFHITWSLDRAQGFRPVMSNALIQERGWEIIPDIRIRIAPEFFPQ